MKRSEVIGLINMALEDGSTPVVHPNGFIQLKLSDGRRMHFWHENIPRQDPPSPIHDHIFDMHSEVIAGVLIQEELKVVPEQDGYFDIYEARPISDGSVQTELVSMDTRARVDRRPALKLIAGDKYDFPAFLFHETRDRLGPAISVISKGQEYPEFRPRVLIEHGTEPDNDFDREGFNIGATLGMIETVTNRLLPS